MNHTRTILNRLKNKSNHVGAKDEPTWFDELIRFIKTVFNWTSSNAWPAINSRKSYKYIRISFEELCEFPLETLKKIEQGCKIDLSDTINRVKNGGPGQSKQRRIKLPLIVDECLI